MNDRTGTTGPIAPKAQRIWLVPGLLALVLALFLASLATGPVRLSLAELLSAVAGKGDEAHRVILLDIRLPRAILALAIGFMLGLAGAAMQGLLRNPLAAPSLFGAPQAAAFAAVVTISLGLNDTLSWGLPVAAIIGAFLSVFLLVAIAGRNASLLLLILAGLAVSSLAGAGTALAMNLAANPFAALEIAFWLMGSLEDRSMRHVTLALPFIWWRACCFMRSAARFVRFRSERKPPRASAWRWKNCASSSSSAWLWAWGHPWQLRARSPSLASSRRISCAPS